MGTDLTRRTFLIGATAMAAAAATGMRPAEAASTGPALFVAAHPDDETIAMGVALAEHVTAGQDVHVLWLTRGTTSGARAMLNGSTVSGWWGVRHNPAAEGYAPLSASEFGQARIDEATTAVRCLGGTTFHEAGLIDGQVTISAAEQAIRAVADQINPGGPVRIKTHSLIVDNHPDHLATGAAAHHLQLTDPRFADVRHYVLPPYWTDSRLPKVWWWDTPASIDIRRRAINAYRAFSAWHPPASYAIGMHSVASMFVKLTADPRCMVHG